jgi:hypothetical protein
MTPQPVTPAESSPVKTEIQIEVPKKVTAIEAQEFLDKDHSDSNMVVAIRVRPLSQREISNMEFSILSIEDKLMVLNTHLKFL